MLFVNVLIACTPMRQQHNTGALIDVELIYLPTANESFHRHLKLSTGSSVRDVIFASGILDYFPEVLARSVGIFSKLVSLETLIKQGDRVEIYRELALDPKEKRRKKAFEEKLKK